MRTITWCDVILHFAVSFLHSMFETADPIIVNYVLSSSRSSRLANFETLFLYGIFFLMIGNRYPASYVHFESFRPNLQRIRTLKFAALSSLLIKTLEVTSSRALVSV